MLYDPELHEPLTDEAWDEGRVRDAIARIVADADAAFDPERLWPAEEWDVYMATPPLKELYVGASGVIWALDALRRRGLAATGVDLSAAAARTLEAWRERPDYSQWDPVPKFAASALLAGESGPLIVAWRISPSSELADALFTRVRENVGNEAVEVMWGAPGTMLAAQAMLEWTGEERWAEAWTESAESVWAARRSGASPLRTASSGSSRPCGPTLAATSSNARRPRRLPGSPFARAVWRTGRPVK